MPICVPVLDKTMPLYISQIANISRAILRPRYEVVEMKSAITVILLMAFCLGANSKPIDVGGDFGRAWINNFLAQNPKPVEQNNSTDLSSWGGAPKGKELVDGKLVDQQNATNPLNPTTNWLGDPAISGNGISPAGMTFNGSSQALVFSNNGIIKPIHAIDATWNKTLQGPQPDANGLINGIPAEMYDAIGPALFNF